MTARRRARDPPEVRAMVVIDRSRRMPFAVAFPPPMAETEVEAAFDARRRARNAELAVVAAQRGQQAHIAADMDE